MMRRLRHFGIALAGGAFLVVLAAGQYDDEPDPMQDPAMRRMISSLAWLMLAGLLVLIFTVGAYLVIRVGRNVAQKPPAAKPTEYVDAWSRYRLTDEQISAAMRDLQDGGDDGGPRPGPAPPAPEAPEGPK